MLSRLTRQLSLSKTMLAPRQFIGATNNQPFALSRPNLFHLSRPNHHPLAKILSIILPMVTTALLQAFGTAYQQVLNQAKHSTAGVMPARRAMTRDDAFKILGLESNASEKEVRECVERLIEINTPKEDFCGSPYLVKKVTAARNTLLGIPREEEAPAQEQQEDDIKQAQNENPRK